MIFLLLLFVLGGLETTVAQNIGVCYGRVADNLPPAREVIDLYKANGIGRMRIYDTDPTTIEALRGSNIELVVGVLHQMIPSLASPEAATSWVQTNIVKYAQDVKFKYIVVGNEIDSNDAIAQSVLPAMMNIYAALESANLQSRIKVSIAINMALLGSSYPPSTGAFSTSSSPYIEPIVNFLVKTGAPLLANVYTYFSYIGDTKDIDLSYALFTSSNVVVKDGKYTYTNLFDATLGSIYAALEKVGAPNLQVVVSESGWPSSGGIAATVDNAQTYYKNFINHASGGTPYRPNQPIEVYLFAMFDEYQKGPAETEKHFGLFTPNKQPKYQIHFTSNTNKASSSSAHSREYFASFFLSLLFYTFCKQVELRLDGIQVEK